MSILLPDQISVTVNSLSTCAEVIFHFWFVVALCIMLQHNKTLSLTSNSDITQTSDINFLLSFKV